MIDVRNIWLFVSVVFYAACQSPYDRLPSGISSEYSGYVPARIAVLQCQQWPEGAQFGSRILSRSSSEDLARLCKKYDEFVLQGFKDQPYMRGFSPSSVQKILDDAGESTILQSLPAIWSKSPTKCMNCENPQSVYFQTIKDLKDWREWLRHFSSKTRFADAVLLPFLVTAYETQNIDRGAYVHTRGAMISLLLVDTTSGVLLWSGMRHATADQQIFADAGGGFPPSPDWGIVEDRLFTEDVWKDFPGRQVYR